MPPTDDLPTAAEIHARRREEMKAAILAHARAVMRERGVAGLSLGEVARRLGVKTPSLYEYFPNKLAVYDGLFRQGFEQFAAGSKAVHEQHEGAALWTMGRAAMEYYMTFAYENPELFKLLFERHVPDFEPSAESMAISLGALHEGQQTFLLMVVEQGIPLPDDISAGDVYDVFIALAHGLTALHIANQPHLPPGQGRFGHLLDTAMLTLRRAWGSDRHIEEEPTDESAHTA